MDAVIIAGGDIRAKDPLFPLSKNGKKALIEIAGKPMVQWVIDALNQSDQIDRIIITGLSEDAKLSSDKHIIFLEGGRSLMESILIGMRKILVLNPDSAKCLVVSCDIPLINREIIEWFVHASDESGVDIFYDVVRKDVMEDKFPSSGRSYIKLKDAVICGGDMHIFNPKTTIRDGSKWINIVESRKYVSKLMLLFGFEVLFRFLFLKPTLIEVAELVCTRFGLNGRVLTCPFAESGMDIDNIHQFEIVESALTRVLLETKMT